MTTFYCIRHGKTEFNQNGIFQGGLVDSPLLPDGIENAKKAGLYLKNIQFSGVYVSPQKRAQDTARAILSAFDSPKEITTVDDLREMEFGSWDGQPEADYYEEEEFQNLVHRPDMFDPSSFGGETYQSLINRALNVFERINALHPHGNVLIVSHGLTLQSSIKFLNGYPISDLRKGNFLDNTSITTIEKAPNAVDYTILHWNDIRHLS